MEKLNDWKLEVVISDAEYNPDGKMKSATVWVPKSYIESEIVKAIDNHIKKETARTPSGLMNEMSTPHGS